MINHSAHIILVGMPCSGKTTLGAVLAERLGRPLVDLDERMLEESGQTVGELRVSLGDDDFLKYEEEVLGVVLAEQQPLVISTGGSMVLNESARKVLRGEPLVVWLRTSLDVIVERVVRVNRAAFIVGVDVGADKPLAEQLALVEAVREPLYAQVAKVHVDLADVPGATEAVEVVLAKLGEAVLRRSGAANS